MTMFGLMPPIATGNMEKREWLKLEVKTEPTEEIKEPKKKRKSRKKKEQAK